MATPAITDHLFGGTIEGSRSVYLSVPEYKNPHHLDPADPRNLQDADKPVWERIEIATEGEDCDECVRKLRDPLMRIKGVQKVEVDTNRERVMVTFDARKTHAPDLHDAILKSGYKPAPVVE